MTLGAKANRAGDIINDVHNLAGSSINTILTAEIPAGDEIIGKVYVTDGTDDVAVETDGSLNTNATLQAGTAIAGKVYVTDGTEDADVITAADDDTNLDGTNGLVTNSIQHYRTDVDTVKPARMDGTTHSLQIIDYAHHEIHAGSSYTVSDTVACDTATCQWQITTPDTTKYSHLVFTLTATGEATFLVTEGSDRVDGTALTEVNRRRVGTPTAAGTIVTRTPTEGTTDGAITLFSIRNGISTIASKNIEGGQTRATNEWILKPNTKYVVSITTYTDVFVSLLLDWYEHTDR